MPLLAEKSRLGQKVVVRRMRRRRNNLSRGLRWENRKRSHRSSYGRVLYNYFRTYDPSTGRYLESDPIGLRGGLNSYLYASASPTNRADRLGLLDYDATLNGGTIAVGPGAGGFELTLVTQDCIDGKRTTVKLAIAGATAGLGAKLTFPFSPTEDFKFTMSDTFDYVNLDNMDGAVVVDQAGVGIGIGYSCTGIHIAEFESVESGKHDLKGVGCGFGKTLFDFGVTATFGSSTIVDVQTEPCDSCATGSE